MEHFSHEHLLILQEEREINGEKIKCNGCLDLISGPFYSCEQCIYFLHNVCAELPGQMKHPMHPQHPLALLADPPFTIDKGFSTCDACGKRCQSFVYRCSLCNFGLDIICASLAHRIEHKCHHHSLIPLQKPAFFHCDGCRTKHEGISFKCGSCPFWVHQNCALLPKTIKLSDDDHLLTLHHSLPGEYSRLTIYCDICHKFVNVFEWVYYCAGCRYFAHINCATSKRVSSEDKNTGIEDEVIDPNPVILPVPYESIDLITRFVKKTFPEEIKIATKLDHFGHDHPLILSDEQINEELLLGNEGKISYLNEVKNSKICEACVRPISAPFYSCKHCNYFLHKCCAELPKQIQHLCHPEHPLRLVANAPEDFDLFWCRCCRKTSNGFTFTCSQCNFYLDVNCGSLSGATAIKHEGHKHLLIPRVLSPGRCSTCLLNFTGLAFVCGICNFILCTDCAMLPNAVGHRYDKHPFILTYSPTKDHPDEYYCEICEEEVNPKCWFYHCGDCDQSVHSLCMSNYLIDSHVKYGASFEVKAHPHLLTFVRFTRDYCSRCNICSRYVYGDYPPGLECAPCKFTVHLQCLVSPPPPPKPLPHTAITRSYPPRPPPLPPPLLSSSTAPPPTTAMRSTTTTHNWDGAYDYFWTD